MLLDQLIKDKDISLYKVSKDTGIPYTTLRDLVTGKTDFNKVSVKVFNVIAGYLGFSMDDLYNKLNENLSDEQRIYDHLPSELKESIDLLNKALEDKQPLIDCELSQVLGDINMSESWGLIDSVLAKELRDKYVFDILEGLENG